MSQVKFGLVQATWTRTSRRNLDIGTRRTAIHAKCMEKRTGVLQGRPQPVINWIISPISRFISPATHVFAAIYKGPKTSNLPQVESTSKKLPTAAPRHVESSKCWWFLPEWWEELFTWSQGKPRHGSRFACIWVNREVATIIPNGPHLRWRHYRISDWIEWSGQPTSSGVFKRAPFIKIRIYRLFAQLVPQV